MTSERLVELAERLEEWSRGCQPESPLIITASLVQNIAAELRAMAGEDDEMDAWRVQAVDELRELHLALATAIAERDAARAEVERARQWAMDEQAWGAGQNQRARLAEALVREMLELADNWPGIAYTADLEARAKALASVEGEAGGGGG